jgi:hypothetical protein
VDSIHMAGDGSTGTTSIWLRIRPSGGLLDPLEL